MRSDEYDVWLLAIAVDELAASAEVASMDLDELCEVFVRLGVLAEAMGSLRARIGEIVAERADSAPPSQVDAMRRLWALEPVTRVRWVGVDWSAVGARLRELGVPVGSSAWRPARSVRTLAAVGVDLAEFGKRRAIPSLRSVRRQVTDGEIGSGGIAAPPAPR